MAHVRFRIDTPLSPAQVLAVLTDFGPERAKAWPNIDEAHFKLHEKGADWAHVTEGSALAGGVWEEERYSWDSAAGTVSIKTLDSNTWGPGSGWNYTITPGTAGGSTIEVDVVRNPMGFKAGLIAALLTIAGTDVLRSQMETALKRVRG